MLSTTTCSRRSSGGASCNPLWNPLVAACGVLCAVIFLAAPPSGLGATPASAAKTTSFSGHIVSGTGRYAGSRGSVRLILRSTRVAGTVNPGGSFHDTFTLALSAPACASQTVRAGRCVALSGTLHGTSVVTGVNPDGPKTGTLTAHGRIAPLGAATAGGTASGLGFIRVGRFQLQLHLRNAAGSITIAALSPQVPGFSSPF